ncbi:MAG: HU family DNA-binding protein, partial [Polyangiaceae bacterium]|nr:HU family DNA-binding protein [Polyangiaceae bacterium]
FDRQEALPSWRMKMAGKKSEAKKPASISKSALVNAVVEESGDVTRKQVKAILDSLADIGYRELKKNGIFTLPGFAKFRVVKKPATKAREGINPFTKQPMTFAAKPASKSVRARPIKSIKDAMG